MATNKQSLCAIYAALYNIDIDKEIYKFLINQIQLEDMIPTDKFCVFYFVLLQIFLRKKGSSVYPLMMMMIAPNSLVRQKQGVQGEKEEEEKKGRTDRNTDARRGRSHSSNSVMGCRMRET